MSITSTQAVTHERIFRKYLFIGVFVTGFFFSVNTFCLSETKQITSVCIMLNIIIERDNGNFVCHE